MAYVAIGYTLELSFIKQISKFKNAMVSYTVEYMVSPSVIPGPSAPQKFICLVNNLLLDHVCSKNPPLAVSQAPAGLFRQC